VTPEVGQHPSILDDRYDLIEVVGTGGMGVVWRAYDRTLHRQVACKVLSGSRGRDPVFEKRFRREAHHIASLSHPNIVVVFDSGTDDGRPFIVMEYVQGASLRQVLDARSVLAVPVAAALALDVLGALGHAHGRDIVHRDVKPANLLLQTGGNVKVADFGIAKSLGEITEITVQGAFVGSASYASPEQLAGHRVSASSDLYSLGCVIFECLSGRAPFVADDPDHLAYQHRFAEPPPLRELRDDIPDSISEAVARALAKDPSDRFVFANEMADIFRPYAVEAELRALLPPSPPESESEDAGQYRHAPTPIRLPTSPPSRTSTDLLPTPRRGAAASKRRRRIAVLAVTIASVAIAIVLTLVTVGGQGDSGRNTKVRTHSTIASGGFLQPGHSITSRNGRFFLVMQMDGNLVDYARRGREKVALWQSGTSGSFNAYVVMQEDGDLVVYPQGKTAPTPGQPTSALFSSATYGHHDSFATLMNNGVLVVRAPKTDRILWSSPITKLTRHRHSDGDPFFDNGTERDGHGETEEAIVPA
jgi:eukaryotic-like serine/threonine-protein kinase